MTEDGEAARSAHFFELSGSELADGVANISEGFVSLELGSKHRQVGKGFKAHVFLDVWLVTDVFDVDFITDVRQEG